MCCRKGRTENEKDAGKEPVFFLSHRNVPPGRLTFHFSYPPCFQTFHLLWPPQRIPFTSPARRLKLLPPAMAARVYLPSYQAAIFMYKNPVSCNFLPFLRV